MLDLHNKGCACFKCAPAKDFALWPGDVLTPKEDSTCKAFGEIKIIAIVLSPAGNRRAIYTSDIGTCSWDALQTLNIIKRITDPPKNDLDHWSEGGVLSQFNLK